MKPLSSWGHYGGVTMTTGLSSVGPPPALMLSQMVPGRGHIALMWGPDR
jgi:hypothetical protein